jgi:hypothetical protein
MRLCHRPTREAARHILAEGFRDGTGRYMTATIHHGVWLSDQILDANEGARGDTVIEILIPPRKIRAHKWIEAGKPYGKWLVSATIVNTYGTVRIVPDEV